MKKFIYKYFNKLFFIHILTIIPLAIICSESIKITVSILYCIYGFFIWFIHEEEQNKVNIYFYNSIYAFRTTFNREPTDEEEDKMYKNALDKYYEK